jgi:hypothetical protein
MRWDRNFEGRIHHIVKEYQEQWTEGRQTIMMEGLEEMEKIRRMRNADIYWEDLLRKKEFKALSTTTIKKKAREIRASCMGAEEITNVAMRVWAHIHYIDQGQAEKRQHIRDHLELYEDFKEQILAQLKQIALEESLAAGDELRMIKFKDLVMLQSIDEEGCSHQEYRNYRIWWLAATKGVEFIRADLECEDEECKWGGSWVNIEELRRWVMEEIAHRTPGGQIPSSLRMARKHFDPTPEERAEIMKQHSGSQKE